MAVTGTDERQPDVASGVRQRLLDGLAYSSVERGYLDVFVFFFSSRRRHTRWNCDWSSDVCSSDLLHAGEVKRHRGGDVLARAVARARVSKLARIGTRIVEDFLERIERQIVARDERVGIRSEERRVGKECRSRWSPDVLKMKK